jgi:hypothetical protein
MRLGRGIHGNGVIMRWETERFESNGMCSGISIRRFHYVLSSRQPDGENARIDERVVVKERRIGGV